MSAEREGDPTTHAIAGVHGPYLLCPVKYALSANLTGSVLVPLCSEDVPEDIPFGASKCFTKEDITDESEWLNPFIDEVSHSLSLTSFLLHHFSLTISPLLVHSTPRSGQTIPI